MAAQNQTLLFKSQEKIRTILKIKKEISAVSAIAYSSFQSMKHTRVLHLPLNVISLIFPPPPPPLHFGTASEVFAIVFCFLFTMSDGGWHAESKVSSPRIRLSHPCRARTPLDKPSRESNLYLLKSRVRENDWQILTSPVSLDWSICLITWSSWFWLSPPAFSSILSWSAVM